jgi:hypothetical protein
LGEALSNARVRSDYRVAETEQVRWACLSVAVALGSFIDNICVVGGLVPMLLIDQRDRDEGDLHIGTNDLDVGLSIKLLDDARYTELAAQLRQEEFEPDVNANGNRTLQRWRLRGKKVTIDFLIAPTTSADEPSRIKHLDHDLGAFIVPGIDLALDERELVTIDDLTLRGERASRQMPVCGPGAFVILKARAFARRGRPKDAYDLVYMLRHWGGGHADIVSRLQRHAVRDGTFVREVLRRLGRDFATLDSIGPSRAAAFLEGIDRDADLADAHGAVDELLTRCRAAGLLEETVAAG